VAKFKEKIEARKLRKEGESIKVIAKKLQVSPSSVSYWCKDIKLSPTQIEILEKRARDPHYGKRLKYALAQQKRRLEKIRKLKEEGKKDIGNLNKRELFLVGVALYWAEGFKKDSQAGFASSDPNMIKLFLRWLDECCGYKTKNLILRVTANISHKYRIGEIQNYWSQITKIPTGNFQKPFYQKVKWKKTYENPEEYFGVLRIRVRKSTDFLRKIHGWIEGLRTNRH
jgi:predicted transcriptional regulator